MAMNALHHTTNGTEVTQLEVKCKSPVSLQSVYDRLQPVYNVDTVI